MASWSSRWGALPCTLRDGLVATGLGNPDLFSLAFGAEEGEQEHGALAMQVGYEEDDGAELIGGLVEICTGRIRRAPTRIAAVSDAEITVWAMKRQKTEKAEVSAAVQIPARRSAAPPPGKAPPARWPKRAEKKLAAASTAVARESVEAEERSRRLTSR